MTNTLFFSIVIPTYNRPKQLAACLLALSRLDYPRECFEVIVVDDGSAQSLETVVARFSQQYDVKLLRQNNAGPGAARNTGVAQAQGEYIAFTDDDCALSPDWLRKLARRVVANPEHLIGGRTLNSLRGNSYAVASQLLIDYIYGYYNREATGEAKFFASNNFCVPRAAFLAMGGFSSDYRHAAAEDREFCDHWLQRSQRMTYAPEVVIYHAHNLSLRSFWKQHFTYGRGAYGFHGARARRAASSEPSKIQIEPLAFYWNLLFFPLTRGQGVRAWPLCFLMGLTQVAHTAGYFYEKNKAGSEAA